MLNDTVNAILSPSFTETSRQSIRSPLLPSGSGDQASSPSPSAPPLSSLLLPADPYWTLETTKRAVVPDNRGTVYAYMIQPFMTSPFSRSFRKSEACGSNRHPTFLVTHMDSMYTNLLLAYFQFTGRLRAVERTRPEKGWSSNGRTNDEKLETPEVLGRAGFENTRDDIGPAKRFGYQSGLWHRGLSLTGRKTDETTSVQHSDRDRIRAKRRFTGYASGVDTPKGDFQGDIAPGETMEVVKLEKERGSV
ncbi:hypothetical protein FA13DRAFT_1717163 [Coprinellus micaceus]|uniref:Uncharacterized protein n=1 Tax=Coprinellus micaceus TaxID=71717 RepID=A0A4Y7SHF7_COPMI|nr:hypothetical protein FA13DRAFT_1717163 [Coprinellus micaceus]